MRPSFRNETMFGARPDWSPAASADFTVEWPEPGDAELEWERDEMHHPFALAPLALDYAITTSVDGLTAGFAYFDVPIAIRARGVNGYLYSAPIYGVPDDEVPATLAAARARFRAFGPHTTAYWNEVLPELLGGYERMRSVDVDGLPPADLVERWQQAWRDLARAWEVHFVIIRGPYRISEDLADRYAAIVPDAPKGAGYGLIQGRVDVLHEVDLGLERLAATATSDPALAAALLGTPRASDAELAALPNGPAFLAAVDDFIAAHGHLGQTYSDLSQPCWSDEPSRLIDEIANRLAHPPEPAIERRARLRAEADALAEDVRRRLADRPEDLAEFEQLLALAREIGPLTETHNYWIDRMSPARIRDLAIRIGRRLTREGTLDAADDILYLARGEIADLILGPRPVQPLVVARRAEHARQRAMQAPPTIGRTHAMGSVSGAPAATPDAAGPAVELLRGVGASAGIIRGPARVTLDPGDFGRIAPGDIVICPATNPSWVPIFAIAAGLVTNTGGVLAHAAVIAREFGLPAVVGVAGATSRILEGRTIEIDGTEGTVRLL
jgi:rifampicin phosphotransferase